MYVYSLNQVVFKLVFHHTLYGQIAILIWSCFLWFVNDLNRALEATAHSDILDVLPTLGKDFSCFNMTVPVYTKPGL